MPHSIAFPESNDEVIISGITLKFDSLTEEEKILVNNIFDIRNKLQSYVFNAELAIQGSATVLLASYNSKLQEAANVPTEEVLTPELVEEDHH
jgi:hypothetical protein